MKMRSIMGAAVAAVAVTTTIPAAAHGVGETVTPHFQKAISNTPGKSLVAVVVDHKPGGASPSHTNARSPFTFAYVLSGEIESQVMRDPGGSSAPARVSRRRRAPAILSAAMQARRSLRGFSRCSSSAPTTRN
jgi:hypothetical protein